uniref:Ig-like domain-containing protein n=1 Tax=Oncorhynchus kisutch TaxID=8019 RepID=A0A8C7HKJ0_ONCKI
MLLFFTGTSVEDIITPDRDVVDVTEGSSNKLSCRYNSSLTNSLLWYLQHPGSSPQFLITTTELIITHLTLADTALYYCALRDCYYENCYTQ